MITLKNGTMIIRLLRCVSGNYRVEFIDNEFYEWAIVTHDDANYIINKYKES